MSRVRRAFERIGGQPAVPVQLLPDPAPAPVEGVAGQPDDVERVHHGGRLGELFGGAAVAVSEEWSPRWS